MLQRGNKWKNVTIGYGCPPLPARVNRGITPECNHRIRMPPLPAKVNRGITPECNLRIQMPPLPAKVNRGITPECKRW
jgi:hypothetical protein